MGVHISEPMYEHITKYYCGIANGNSKGEICETSEFIVLFPFAIPHEDPGSCAVEGGNASSGRF